mgnify:CR=1 FL=1
MIELKPVTEPGQRESLEEVREMTGLVLDTLREEPALDPSNPMISCWALVNDGVLITEAGNYKSVT